MAAKPKLTPEQWAVARRVWEGDHRKGFPWLIEELSLPVSAEALRLRSKSESWEKIDNTHHGKPISAKEVAEKPKALDKIPSLDSCDSPSLEQDSFGGQRGRPSMYRKEYADQAESFCLMGADDKRLAELFDVAESTINLWKLKHPEFSEAIKKGKDVADAAVAAALYKSAMGLHVITEDRVVGEEVVTLEKKLPPEISAQIFWLKNRQPRMWKDKVEIKEEINLNLFPPKEVLDARYEKVLAEAANMEAMLSGRRERLGIVIDQERDD